MSDHPKHIYQWLEAFWKGESSLEQEAALKAYFRERGLPEELQEDKPYFAYIESEKNKGVSAEHFDQEVMAGIRRHKRRQMWGNFFQMAAGLAVLLAVGWWFQLHKAPLEGALQHFHSGHWQGVVDQHFAHYQEEEGVTYIHWTTNTPHLLSHLGLSHHNPIQEQLMSKLSTLNVLEVDSLQQETAQQIFREAISLMKHDVFSEQTLTHPQLPGARFFRAEHKNGKQEWVVIYRHAGGFWMANLIGEVGPQEVLQLMDQFYPVPGLVPAGSNSDTDE